MTVCIAAIAIPKEDEKEICNKTCIVFAADKMVTFWENSFELPIQKYKKYKSGDVVLFSGTLPLIEEVDAIFRELLDQNESQTFVERFRLMKAAFLHVRLSRIAEFLQRYGIPPEKVGEILNYYIQNGELVDSIRETIEAPFQVEALLLGFDKNEPQIMAVNESNHFSLRTLSFHAIGSGAMQAINTLMFAQQHPKIGIKATMYNVYKAKRAAEVATGVGKRTDMGILLPNGDVRIVDNIDLVKLEELIEYEKKSVFRCDSFKSWRPTLLEKRGE